MFFKNYYDFADSEIERPFSYVEKEIMHSFLLILRNFVNQAIGTSVKNYTKNTVFFASLRFSRSILENKN